ncbi:MAG: hypothetical protein DLM72_06655 [Candidatus Nitrosopolaris wilkensis]|nr:MAG: hypothetical protein DLM72_06655 [Candidatus Nitrosopolaris wilkensis]
MGKRPSTINPAPIAATAITPPTLNETSSIQRNIENATEGLSSEFFLTYFTKYYLQIKKKL